MIITDSPYEWMVTLCNECAAPAVIVEPGSEAVRELFLLDRGSPVRCWCMSCWQRRFGAQAVA